jgi:hypothetical protein
MGDGDTRTGSESLGEGRLHKTGALRSRLSREPVWLGEAVAERYAGPARLEYYVSSDGL